MRRKVSLLLTLTAWFFATGSQWDVAQTLGWARMFAGYAQTMPVFEALQKTFSGQELCGICEVVQDARQDGGTKDGASGAAATKSLAKLPLALPPATVSVFAAPEPVLRSARGDSVRGTLRASPPLPPPRAAA
jgi:hypothetical protein